MQRVFWFSSCMFCIYDLRIGTDLCRNRAPLISFCNVSPPIYSFKQITTTTASFYGHKFEYMKIGFVAVVLVVVVNVVVVYLANWKCVNSLKNEKKKVSTKLIEKDALQQPCYCFDGIFVVAPFDWVSALLPLIADGILLKLFGCLHFL